MENVEWKRADVKELFSKFAMILSYIVAPKSYHTL